MILFIVSFIVNKYTNEIISIDVLYAVNAKKEATALIEPELSSRSDVSLTASVISISDLLDYVNDYYTDLLSEDVLKHSKNNTKNAGNKIQSPANTSNMGGLASQGVSFSAIT